MKISKLFHTLYAFLMFLPVMVLPLFAININQKEVEPLTAQIEDTKVVDFNQQFEMSNFLRQGGNFEIEDNVLTFTISRNDIPSGVYKFLPLIVSHKYYLKYTINASYTGVFRSAVENVAYVDKNITANVTSHLDYTFTYLEQGNGVMFFYAFTNYNVDDVFNLFYVNLFDLTQMFGSGNEPTTEQFNLWYPNDYYSYTISRKEILHTGVQNTLSNTDIGSQFLYSLYNPLKDYFNLPNYMNLGGLYDWFLVNLFSGYNSPVYFIIFDLMIYWLAMSILWLIFDVLMYVPSMIHKILDKARME